MPGSHIPDTRRILAAGKRRGDRIDLHGTGLPILQQAMLATGVVEHWLAASGQQCLHGNEEPPLAGSSGMVCTRLAGLVVIRAFPVLLCPCRHLPSDGCTREFAVDDLHEFFQRLRPGERSPVNEERRCSGHTELGRFIDVPLDAVTVRVL